MKKVIVFILLIYSVSLHCQDKYQSTDNMLSTYKQKANDGYSWRYRENTYDKTENDITKEKLLSTIWITDPLEATQYTLVFYKDDVFKIGTRQTGVEISGKYLLENDSILLSEYNLHSDYLTKTGLMFGNMKCTFNIDPNHFLYRDFINIRGVKYYAVGSEHLNGTELTYNNIQIIVNLETKVMNENMKFRDYPSVNGELIKVYQYSEYTSNEILSIKKGTIVDLLAKTKKNETIDGVTASWYFIKIFDGFEWYQYGWVFGGYFSDYDQNKKNEYWKTVLEELKK